MYHRNNALCENGQVVKAMLPQDATTCKKQFQEQLSILPKNNNNMENKLPKFSFFDF